MSDFPHTKNSGVQPLNSPWEGEDETRRTSIAALLLKLSQHYYRADRSHEATLELLMDFYDDLASFSVEDIALGCAHWRRGDHHYFPSSGELIKSIRESTFTPEPSRAGYRALPAPQLPPGSDAGIAAALRRLGQPNAARAWEEEKKIVPRYSLDRK